MNSHPAYPINSSSHTILAMVTSAFEANPSALSLRLITSRGTHSAWITKEKIPFQIAVGQVWNFTGQIVNLEEYGEQFEVSDAFPSLPADQLLVPFLAWHVPGMSQTRAQRIWEELGNELIDALANGTVTPLARAHGGRAASQIAMLAVIIWKEKVTYTQLVKELYQYNFTERVLYALIRHYGHQSLNYIQDDPYRLLAFAKLEPVDQAAMKHFGISANDRRRLMGIVDAAVHTLYDGGIAIFSQLQLRTAIFKLASLERHQVPAAIDLALQHGRLVTANECYLMGDGFERIERSVIEYLDICIRSTVEQSAVTTCMSFEGNCEIGKIAFEAAAVRVSIIIAHEPTAALKFIRCIVDLFIPLNKQCYIVAGSNALSQKIQEKTGLQAISLDQAVTSGLGAEENELPSRVILIFSSTIDFLSMSKLLLRLRTTDQIFFIGRPLPYCGGRLLLLPALLQVDQICRRELPSDSTNSSTVDFLGKGFSSSGTTRIEYNPRQTERCGVFWICVAEQIFEQAIVGISYQLCRHGSVAVITRNANERQYFQKLFDMALNEMRTPIEHGTILSATPDELESGDTDSSVIVLRQPMACDAVWFNSALDAAISRTVVVYKVESDHQFQIMQDDSMISNGFVTRWREVIANTETQG